MTSRTWTMWFVVDHVHDGDTLIGELDQGLGVHQRPVSVRLAGIDTPELGTENGDKARDALYDIVYLWANSSPVLRVESVKWDKYAGRVDAYAWTLDGIDLAAELVRAGLALTWTGRGPRPWNADGTRREAAA